VEYLRFDTILDIDHTGYVIHPTLQRPIKLTAQESSAKYYYIKVWRNRLESLRQVAAYKDTGNATPIPTSRFPSCYPLNQGTYKPSWPMRYEEYLSQREALG
jgi:hypothetical protein